MFFDQSPLISEIKEKIPSKFPFNQTAWKELYLTSLPSETKNFVHFQTQKQTTNQNKNSNIIPKFSYSQSFAYNNKIYLMKVTENILTVFNRYLVYNPKRVSLPKDAFSIIPQTSTSQRFFNQRLTRTFQFQVNISGTLCFGSIDNHAYMIVPLISGQCYIIDLALEDYILDQDGNNIRGSVFELNTNGCYLLGIQNISNMFKDQEKAWNLVIIASLSTGIMTLYEVSLEANFEKISFEAGEVYIKQINPHSEINPFYSGLLGKVKSYSDYYLKNENDTILASHYFSNFLCFVLTKEMVFKLINIYTRTIIMETTLDDFKVNRSKKISLEGFWPHFKIISFDKNPFLVNEEGILNIVILIAELDNKELNYVKFLNIALNIKKYLLSSKRSIIDFDLSLVSSEDIASSAEITLNENLSVSANKDQEIVDFSINHGGVWVASFDEVWNRSQLNLFEFNEKRSFQARKIFNCDERLDDFLQELEKSENFIDLEDLINCLMRDQRYPSSELSRMFEEGELTGNKISFRRKLRKILAMKKDFKDLKNQIFQMSEDYKLNNRITSLYIDKNYGFPIIWRENSINCLIKIDFIEEMNERSELLKNELLGSTLNRFLLLIKEIGNDLYYPNDSLNKFFQMNLLLKTSLQITQEKLIKAIQETNENEQSFFNFLSDRLKEQLHLIDRPMMWIIKESIIRFMKEGFDGEGFLEQIMKEILSPMFKENRNPASMDIAEFNLSINTEEWSSLIYALCAGKVKSSLNAYAGFCLDLLVFYIFLESFSFEFELNMKKTSPEHYQNIEKLSRLAEMLIGFNFSMNQDFQGMRENKISQIISDLLEGDQFIDVSRVFLVENHMNLLEVSKSFNYSKGINWVEESCRRIMNDIILVNYNRLEIDYVPKLMKFFIEKSDHENFIKLHQILKIKNPSIEFLKCLALIKSEDFAKINQALNYVNSFVNFEKFPLEKKKNNEDLEKRMPLCLGPWFIYQHMEEENNSSVVKLQNMLLEKFFFNNTVRSSISFNASCLANVKPGIKLTFMKEIINYQLNQKNFQTALNIFIFSLGLLQKEKPHQFFFTVLEELYKAGQTRLLMETPLDGEVNQKIRELIIAQSEYHMDIMVSSLKEKTKNLTNINENSSVQLHIWRQYISEPPLIQTIIQFYLEQSNFNEAIEILISHLRKLLKITMIDTPLSREFYLEILKLCQSTLSNLIFIFDMQNSNDNCPILLNETYFKSQFRLYQQEKQLINGFDPETQDYKQNLDLAVLFNKISISENCQNSFQSENSLKKVDFHRFYKKLTVLIELICLIDSYESHRFYSVDMDSELLIKYLIKAGLVGQAVDFVNVCDIYALNLMIYLAELYYKLGKGIVHKDFTQEIIWDMIERIINNTEEKRNREYCKVFAEKIMRNNLQRGLEEDDLPAVLLEKYLNLNPVGLILLYIKYKKLQKAGLIVLNYVRAKMIQGNKLLTEKKALEGRITHIPANIILTVMNYEDNINIKFEIEELLRNLNL